MWLEIAIHFRFFCLTYLCSTKKIQLASSNWRSWTGMLLQLCAEEMKGRVVGARIELNWRYIGIAHHFQLHMMSMMMMRELLQRTLFFLLFYFGIETLALLLFQRNHKGGGRIGVDEWIKVHEKNVREKRERIRELGSLKATWDAHDIGYLLQAYSRSNTIRNHACSESRSDHSENFPFLGPLIEEH